MAAPTPVFLSGESHGTGLLKLISLYSSDIREDDGAGSARALSLHQTTIALAESD